MATIKSYTDISQSKKLAELLPIESADMHYPMLYNKGIDGGGKNISDFPSTIKSIGIEDIPCWSLAALLGILPKIGAEEPIIQKLYYANNPTERYICQYSLTNITGEYDNPVDACMEMIEKLHELNLL